MVVLRLALRPDARLVVAALGAAAAMLLPAAAVLVSGGLALDVDPSRWLAVPEPGAVAASDPPAGALEAVAAGELDGTLVAAWVVGDPRVPADTAVPMPLAAAEPSLPGGPWTVRAPESRPRSLVPADAVLVHPSRLPTDAWIHAAILPSAAAPAGYFVHLARGADAFEAQGTMDVQGSTAWLIAVSLPAVAVVAAVFASQEARHARPAAALLAALGRPGRARVLLALRAGWMVALATALCVAGVGALLATGGDTFGRPSSWRLLALAVAAPAATALAVGMVRAPLALGSAVQLVRAPPSTHAPAGPRLARVPLLGRPLALGLDVVPLLALAGLLFVADVGFPLAAASVPAALAGDAGEWVVGASDGLVAGGSTQAARAHVLAGHPAIAAIVAEVVLPTTVGGHAAVVRGAPWSQFASYHGVSVTPRPPGDGEVALGAALAKRLDASVGDRLAVQAAGAPGVAWLDVSGIMEADGLLRDEAVVSLARAQALGGLQAEQVSVVRARPGTTAVRMALSVEGARIEVLDVRIDPPDAAAGAMAHAVATVANVGSERGRRELTLRIDGVGVSYAAVDLPPQSTQVERLPFIVPDGPFVAQVNPSVQVEPAPRALRLHVPAIVVPPDSLHVVVQRSDGRLVADAQVIVVGSGGDVAASVRTDGSGLALVDGLPPGRYVATSGGAAAEVLVADPARRAAATFEVVQAWVDEPSVAPGRPVHLHAVVQNVGGAAGAGKVDVLLDGTRIHVFEERLDPGGVRHVEVSFTPTVQPTAVAVGGRIVALRADPESGGHVVRDTEVRRGGEAQAQVAKRVLGDATAVLGAVAGIAMASTLAIVFLGTDRALRGRQAVLAALATVSTPAWVRGRASAEAGAAGALAAAGAVLVAKAAFAVVAATGRPILFGHAPPDPFSLLVGVQVVAAFAAAAAGAAYLASGAVVAAALPMGSRRGDQDPLPAAPAQDLLEAP